MAYIESHQELGSHPKTRKLARLLGVSRVTAVGHLQFLWWWAVDYADDGDLTRFTDLDIALGCEWEGDEAAFVAALAQAGFLDPDRRLHDWDVYAGRLIEQRALRAQRARRNRGLYNDDELVRIVRSRDGDQCRYCGGEVDWKDRRGSKGGTYDHVDPEAVPENTPENVVVACRSCNSAKGRRNPEAAGLRLLPVGSGKFTAKNLPSSAVNQPTEQTVTKRTVAKQTEPERGNDPPTPRPAAPERTPLRPYSLLEAVCDELGQDAGGLSKPAKERQLASAKRLIEAGVGEGDIRSMVRWLAPQPWVNGAVDMGLLEKQLPKWEMAGRPNAPPGRTARNGRDVGWSNADIDAFLAEHGGKT